MVSPNEVPDVRKTVEVDADVDQAFAVFAERPLEWWPEHHVFVTDRRSITIEPHEGGRYYEVGADGTEIAWGTVIEWKPPHRIVLTWRVGPNWRPVFDDEKASLIEVDFESAGPARTVVSLTHSNLHRHGEIAEFVHTALDGPSPGDTLARYRDVVARHVRPAAGAEGGEGGDGDGPVTLINRFTLTGPAADFETAFATTAAFFARQPGFIDHNLLRQTDEPDAYVNVARWTNGAALRAAVSQPEFREHAVALRAVSTSEPKVFAVRLTTTAPNAA